MIKRFFRWAVGLNDKIKFIFVGCLNTLIANAVYLGIMAAFGYGAFQANPDVPFYLIFSSTLAGQLLGLVNSYFWNKYFTFNKREKSGWEIARFVGVYAVTYAVDYGLKYGFRIWFHLREIYIVLIVLIFTTILSYFGQRYLVFRRNGKSSDEEKPGDAGKDETSAPEER